MKSSDNPRTSLLEEAVTIVNGERNNDYGDPLDDFSLTAHFWQEYLRRIAVVRGSIELRPHDVAVMMTLVKISRLTQSPTKRDHWTDIAGYTGCGWDCVVRQDA